MTRTACSVATCALVALAGAAGSPVATLAAQSYRARIDAAVQRADYHGLRLDSLDRSLAIVDSTGTIFTPDGFRLRCGAATHCYFFRPGPRFTSVPLSVSGSVTAWGLGVAGLSARGTARLTTDLGGDGALPTLGPFAQLLEGFLEYEVREVRLRGGRQLLASRLEPLGFDGVAATLRIPSRSLEVGGYAGWGLDRASALPITDPALDPLDEWRPRRRQVVAGLEGAWTHALGEVRGEYRREVDPVDHHFVSERATLSGAARRGDVRISAGFDYDLVAGHVGSGDLTLSYLHPRLTVSAGTLRYRPYFSLWTLWGAFSPVGYDAAFASASIQAASRLTIRGRAERFAYDDAAISTGLLPALTDDGWRLGTSATVLVSRRVTIEGGTDLETGPGANARTVDLSLEIAPLDALRLWLHAGTVRRPLELRYFDAADRWVGGRAEWTSRGDRRLWVEALGSVQERQRPDAGGARHWQTRLRTGLSLALGDGADRRPLPPAVRPVR